MKKNHVAVRGVAARNCRIRLGRAWWLALPVCLAIAASAAGNPRPASSARPNIILIMADDLGYGDLGCYGQNRILTPHIDALARGGLRFTQAYAGSAVCAPSRSSLMTGRHNGHNRIRDNLPHGVALRPDDVTVAEVLKKAGYQTAAIGKWALGDAGTWGVPNAQGFDYFYGELNQDLAIDYYPASLWENDRVVLLQELVMEAGIGIMKGNRAGQRVIYAPDRFDERAQAFIRENRERPFFLYYAATLPHFSDYPADTPDHFMVPDDAPYNGRNWSQSARNYAAMVTRFDRTVGGVVELLRELGIEQNTLVIVTSDNGAYHHKVPLEFFRSSGKLRGAKRDLYEGGIRVPLIARWPGGIAPGLASDHVTAGWDHLATFAELAGLPAVGRGDGISYAPSLLGEPNRQQGHPYLYWDYGHTRPNYQQAVRWGDWKAVRSQTDGPIELYNLASDLSEKHDVAGSHPEVVERLAEIMRTAPTPSSDYPIVSRQVSQEAR